MFYWYCNQERNKDAASTCVIDRIYLVMKILKAHIHFRESWFLNVRGCETVCVGSHAPEWVVKLCMYFLVGTPLALDVDAGCAAVTSGRSKGKYGEHLQPQTQDKRGYGLAY